MSQNILYDIDPDLDTKKTLHEYIIQANGLQTKFLLKNNYVFPKYLGGGSQGMVVGAWDKVNEQHVAIKKMNYDTKAAWSDIQKEISIYRSLNQENTVSLLDTYQSANCTNKEGSFYMVMELMDGDLFCIRNKLNHRKLSFLLFQLITGVNYLHSVGIVHRDLKPHNVGVSKNCSLKIFDFGLSCRIERNELLEHSRVGTLHYQAPEILLGNPYNQSADMWAVGCICAEIVFKETLFSGSNEEDQLELICQSLGQPSQEFLQQLDISQRTLLNYYTQDLHERSIESLLPDEVFDIQNRLDLKHTEQFRDLVSRLLEIDPAKRIRAADALEHPYLSVYKTSTRSL